MMNKQEQFEFINSIPYPIAIIDKKCCILILNSLIKSEFGINLNEGMGKSIFDVIPFLKPKAEFFFAAIANNERETIDKLECQLNGENTFFSVTVSPIVYEGEKKIIIYFQNITEDINLQENIFHNDKLVLIGTLTAGIIHEINNPINFINTAIQSIDGIKNDVLELLNKYHEIKDPVNFSNKIKEAKELSESLEIDIAINEVDELFAAIRDGSLRASKIASDIKFFAKKDVDVMEMADIHKGIESTLTLLRNNYKDNVEIIKEYGKVPLVKCFPGKLNQVFMNILSNAMDSIKTSGKIWIKTFQSEDNVVIKIKDTGSGISEENQLKIFEPFFTTKKAGSGTGLGLSISSSIIKSHNGKITVGSTLGIGTEFTIIIPTQHP